jgi:acyl carrier protein
MDNLSLIREFLFTHRNIDPQRVTLATTLEDLEIDSLMLLDLLFELEEKLGVVLTQNLPQPRTIGDIDALLSKLRDGKAA